MRVRVLGGGVAGLTCALAMRRLEGRVDVVAIGDLYRFDRFAAPATLWQDLQEPYPELLAG